MPAAAWHRLATGHRRRVQRQLSLRKLLFVAADEDVPSHPSLTRVRLRLPLGPNAAMKTIVRPITNGRWPEDVRRLMATNVPCPARRRASGRP
ncbi:MAG: hypothetical protein ACF8TS_21155 [Maioricimonas sp. JB049]